MIGIKLAHRLVIFVAQLVEQMTNFSIELDVTLKFVQQVRLILTDGAGF